MISDLSHFCIETCPQIYRTSAAEYSPALGPPGPEVTPLHRPYYPPLQEGVSALQPTPQVQSTLLHSSAFTPQFSSRPPFSYFDPTFLLPQPAHHLH